MASAKVETAHLDGQPQHQATSAYEEFGRDKAMEAISTPYANTLALDDSSETLPFEAKLEQKAHLARTLMARSQHLGTLYQKTWLLEDVEERIRIVRNALLILSGSTINSAVLDSTLPMRPAADEDANVLGICLYELSAALGDRYKHTGQLGDLDEQMRFLRLTSGVLADDLTLATPALIQRDLGTALRFRFIHNGEDQDILEAFRLHSSLLDKQAEGDSSRPRLLYDLAYTLYVRNSRFADDDDLTWCISLLKEALGLIPKSDPCHYSSQYILGKALFTQHLHGGDVSLLHAADSIFRGNLHLQPANHPDRWMLYDAISGCMAFLFDQINDIECLNEAVKFGRCALEVQSPGNPNRLRAVINLGGALGRRFQHSSFLEDLHESIRVLRSSLTALHSSRSIVVAQLAICLKLRYEALGLADDLDESIRLNRDVLIAAPQGHQMRKRALNSLATGLRERYKRDRNIDDITEAINLARETSSFTQNPRAYGLAVINLIWSLICYHEDVGDRDKLEEANELCKIWLGQNQLMIQPDLHGSFLSAYANTLGMRYLYTHDEQDLSMAISYHEESLKCRGAGHMGRHVTLMALADVLSWRFELSQNAEDIKKAAEVLMEARACLPDGHPDRATPLFKLARLHLFETASFFCVQIALDNTIQALTDRCQNAQTRLESTLDILKELEDKIASFGDDFDLRRALLGVYTLTIELLPRVAYFGLDVESRLRVLAKSDKIAADGSMHALMLAEPCIAIEMLEHGRAVFWSQHLRLRTEFNALPSELAGKLSRTAIELDRGSHIAMHQQKKGENDQEKAARENEAAIRRRLGDDFETLINQARALPGFERFMLPKAFQVLSTAAAKHPLVVLLGKGATCQAVVIENPDTVHQIPLPEVSVQQLRTLSQVMGVAVRRGRDLLRSRAMKKSQMKGGGKGEEVLKNLWNMVMRRIIDAMHLKRSNEKSRPRVTLCTTGLFAHLPIHAAGIYDKSDPESLECVSSYFVPSYTPTIGALLNAQRRLVSTPMLEARLLFAAVSRPSRWAPLPYVADEVEIVRTTVPSQVSVDFLSDIKSAHYNPDAIPTVSTVLKKLPDATIFHVACHGNQDSGHPLSSGFVMHDGMLTVAKLVSLNLDKAFLAFLSACETAKGDKAQPDQAIHLAAAMLFAGFKSVIGTMWSMGDLDGPVVAKTIYEELFHPGAEMLDPETIPYALDSAMRKLRASGLAASRWAPYVHFGA